jgi:hypothetical protein
VTGEVRVELVLPFGLVDPQGRRTRSAALAPLTGHCELSGAADANPFAAVLHLLAGSLVELAGLAAADITPALLGQLLPIDRDYLLLQLHRISFGDVRFHTIECPAPACGRRIDVRFALSSAEPPSVPDRATGSLALADGRRVGYRLPTAADQAALHGMPAEELEAAFLRRCIRDEADRVDNTDAIGAHSAVDPAGVERDGHRVGLRGVRCAELIAMPAAVRADTVARIVAASPEIDLAVPLDCVACGQRFRFVFDPVQSLLTELKASRSDLLRQVHRLALSYHWSQAEILGLPRALRHEYLALLEETAA